MRRIPLYILLLLVLPLLTAQGMQAKDRTARNGKTSNTGKESRDRRDKDNGPDTLTVYMYAASFSFKDSILYISQVEEVPQARVYHTLLMDCERYADSFARYVESTGQPIQVAAVYYDTKLKKALNKRGRTVKRAVKKQHCGISNVGRSEFSFMKD